MKSAVHRGELASASMPAAVGWAAVTPPEYNGSESLPLCILLMGGGGTRQHLIDIQPLLEGWWTDGSLAPMVVATPSGGMSYFHGPWESFVAEDLIRHLRSAFRVGEGSLSTAIAGISMGGYGALKIAFARPHRFGAVAAVQPILEPALRESEVGARNRLHHFAGGPAELIGRGRSAAVVEANNPANRAVENAAAIRESGLAIYIDVGDDDFVNAQDGAEFLHRILWDLDISHEYRLIRGGDHGGPTFVPRLRDALCWVGRTMTELRSEGDEAPAEPGKPVSAGSKEFLRMMREQLKPVRDKAAENDPTTSRRFGKLPK
jgi:S-formylglutathione hydrolase